MPIAAISKLTNEQKVLYIGGLCLLIALAAFAYTNNYVLAAAPFGLLGLAWMAVDFKRFYWFFLLLIPFSVELELANGSLSTTVPDELLMWLMVGLLPLLLLSKRYQLPEWFLRHPITLILFLQFVWLIVAVIFSEQIGYSLKFLAAKIWFLTGFVIFPVLIFKVKKDIVTAFKWVFIPFMLLAIWIFSLHYYNNFGYIESNLVVLPFFVNHVDYSTWLTMLLPGLIAAFQLSKGKPKLRLLLFAIIIFFIPAIFYMGARAAMLAVIFSGVIVWCIKKRIVQWVMPLFYAFILSIIFWLSHDNKYIAFRPDFKMTYTQKSFEDLIVASFKGTDMSSMERFYRWIASIRMSTERPLTGVGPNNFTSYYKEHSVTMFKTYVSRNAEGSTTHNYYLFMLVEQGWPAMILYFILVPLVFTTAQRVYHRTKDKFNRIVTGALIMIFAAGFVNNFFSELIETDKVGALFYLSIVLLIFMDYKTKQEVKAAQKLAE